MAGDLSVTAGDAITQSGAMSVAGTASFTTDVTNDQTTEIERMHALLIGLSSDPRACLAPGMDDAGVASSFVPKKLMIGMFTRSSSPFSGPNAKTSCPPRSPPTHGAAITPAVIRSSLTVDGLPRNGPPARASAVNPPKL